MQAFYSRRISARLPYLQPPLVLTVSSSLTRQKSVNRYHTYLCRLDFVRGARSLLATRCSLPGHPVSSVAQEGAEMGTGSEARFQRFQGQELWESSCGAVLSPLAKPSLFGNARRRHSASQHQPAGCRASRSCEPLEVWFARKDSYVRKNRRSMHIDLLAGENTAKHACERRTSSSSCLGFGKSNLLEPQNQIHLKKPLLQHLETC